jgi:hypothetical protein
MAKISCRKIYVDTKCMAETMVLNEAVCFCLAALNVCAGLDKLYISK